MAVPKCAQDIFPRSHIIPAAMHEKQFCQKPAPGYNVAAVGAHTGVRLWWTLFLMLEFLTFTWMTGSEET